MPNNNNRPKTKAAILFFCLVFTALIAKAQTNTPSTPSVEKSIFGVQTGFLGVWAHNESRLTNSIALRSEVGLDMGLLIGSFYFDQKNVHTVFAPVITLEPRWYYNLKRRFGHPSRKIENNSGNFVGLKISYNPDWFVISNVDNITVFNQVRIIPKWAIRRTVGQHFTYEVGIGLGYSHTFYDEDKYYFSDGHGELALDLHLRIGYTF